MTTMVYERVAEPAAPVTFRDPRAMRYMKRERRTREDALPEHVEYRDEGCDLFASCLSCPLPRCRYDEPGGARTMMNRVRDDEMRRLHYDSGLGVDEIAVRYRLSRRTVFRVLAGAAGHASARALA